MQLPLGADRELFAPARAPAGQYRPSVLGFHAGPKPVRLGAVAIIRLKGAFRHERSNYYYSRSRGCASRARVWKPRGRLVNLYSQQVSSGWDHGMKRPSGAGPLGRPRPGHGPAFCLLRNGYSPALRQRSGPVAGSSAPAPSNPQAALPPCALCDG